MKSLSLSMLPFETDVLLGEVTKNCHRVMPKVVPDQRSKFDNDELFRKLSREGEVVFLLSFHYLIHPEVQFSTLEYT
jgi:hypothetical protein